MNDSISVADRGGLLARAVALAEEAARREPLRIVAKRLASSVIRPLRGALAATGQPPAPAAAGRRDLGGPVWELAEDATRLRLADASPELQEATAALQDLAVRLAPAAGSGSAAARTAELWEMMSGLPRAVQVAADGPYLATNVGNLVSWLGERIPALPQMALCRCGASASKPFCDGSHAGVGFVGAKDPKRIPDRRDAYVGQQVTILDNRGLCQHSGFCTDRLATVFHLGEDPFVTPSGGRMDEIIRAVRDCPSGALSFAIDGQEARRQVDRGGTREPAVEVSKDGPYRVTGGIPLLDGDGKDEPRNRGASGEHYALCRCGHSQNKPFCSGMHWNVDFRDPVPDPDREPTIFEWCGGLPALTRMTRLFYEKHVPQDPLLAPLFATMSADHPERVAKWLGEVFGGPTRYSDDFGGYPRMLSQHIGKGLSDEQRERWVTLILRSAGEAGLPNDAEFRSAFSSYIEWGSRLAVENSQPGCRPPRQMPVPRWDWMTAAGPPGSRMAALAPEAEEREEPVVLPGPEETVEFERHVKPLFRAQDRRSMRFAFDLWAHEDVKLHAAAILERLKGGSMPCDGAWPPQKIEAFERWVAAGMPA